MDRGRLPGGQVGRQRLHVQDQRDGAQLSRPCAGPRPWPELVRNSNSDGVGSVLPRARHLSPEQYSSNAESSSCSQSHLEPVDLDLGAGASETRDQAKVPIAQLRSDGTITVSDPQESVRAHFRRVLHACRIHQVCSRGLRASLHWTQSCAQELTTRWRTSSELIQHRTCRWSCPAW